MKGFHAHLRGRAKPQVIDGERFASKQEAMRYLVLKQRLRSAEIDELELHPRYRLEVRGVHICDYIADFRYSERIGYRRVGPAQIILSEWQLVVEDSKTEATLTPEGKIKLRLMKACHGIDVLLTGPIAKRKAWKVRKA